MISHISFGQVLYVFATSKTVQELANGLVFTVTFVTLCVKLCNFLTKINDMKELLQMFRNDVYQSISLEEEIILRKYKIRNEKFFLLIMTVSQSISLTHLILPIIKWREKLEFPFKVYDPFGMTNFTELVILYAVQTIECCYSVSLNVCFDTMVCGFINLTCCLFDILCLRLKNISKHENLSSMSIRDCFKFHVLVLDILERINSFFMGSVTIVFVLILLVICSGIFQLIEVNLNYVNYM